MKKKYKEKNPWKSLAAKIGWYAADIRVDIFGNRNTFETYNMSAKPIKSKKP